ncbi:unnamed protein product [Somion occarium]|uniref:Protein kinase domain-containing protein n=1 Tax=Somion occarium TaxID=3059160 RepID=A0ABP1E4E5_9APHY
MSYPLLLAARSTAFCTSSVAEPSLQSGWPRNSVHRHSATLRSSRIPQGEETQDILRLRDSFSLKGPNGVHMVLVHDVLGSLLSVVRSPVGQKQVRMLCRQIACGLAALHRHGIVQGDLHAGNAGVALPTLNEHSPREILDYFGHPECTIILPTVLPEHPEAFPPYLVPPISISDYMVSKDPVFAKMPLHAEIMDLGNALVIDERVRPFCTPAAVCAPELMFGRVAQSNDLPPTRASDIWSFACTIYELVFGARLFHFAAPNDALLGAMATLCGEVPLVWKNYWNSRERLSSMSTDFTRGCQCRVATPARTHHERNWRGAHAGRS